MKVSRELYKEIGTVNGSVGDTVEDFNGVKYLIVEVIKIGGTIRNNYRGIRIGNNTAKLEYLYDIFLRCNYG